MNAMSELVYLGLGSNLGDRAANLAAALTALAEAGRVEAVSLLYETAPLYVTDQPPFLNAACRLRTSLAPPALLAALQAIERALGRRPTRRYGPRVVDLDILLYGERQFVSETLTIPHPRLPERAFALAPLAELAPEAIHPVLGQTIAELLRQAPGREGVRRVVASEEWPVDGTAVTRPHAGDDSA